MASRDNHSREYYLDLQAAFLPNDELWAGKKIKTAKLYKFLYGNTKVMKELFEKIGNLLLDLNPAESTAFIAEWERALGIPNDFLPIADTLEQRQKNVLVMLAGIKVETKEDFVNLARLMGYVVDIYTIESRQYPPYNIPYFFNSSPPNRFTWVVYGRNIQEAYPPYNIPYTLIGSRGGGALFAIFEKLKPAFTRMIFYNT